MKITKRQLKRIMRETLNEALPYMEPRGSTQWTPYPPTESEPDHMDSAEYDRGYQDGFDQFPVADDATPDYDVGYEDGILDATIGEGCDKKERSRLHEYGHVGLLQGPGFSNFDRQPNFARAYHGSYAENPAALALKKNQKQSRVREVTYHAGDLEMYIKQVIGALNSLMPGDRRAEIYMLIDLLEDMARK